MFGGLIGTDISGRLRENFRSFFPFRWNRIPNVDERYRGNRQAHAPGETSQSDRGTW
jgi:hypothetical protein